MCEVHRHIFVPTHVLARPVGPHNCHGSSQQQGHSYGAYRDILRVPYEDLHDEDKDVISKAIEKFQNKVFVVLHQDM